MVKERDDISLNKSHAHIIANDKAEDEVHIHIDHYLLLDSFLAFLKEKDSQGTFILETQVYSYNATNTQFKRYYVCFSYVKSFWTRSDSLPQYAIDEIFIYCTLQQCNI